MRCLPFLGRPPLALVALVVPLLAGCSDGGGGGGEDIDFEALQLEATPTTGVIRGVVVDQAVTPVAGATVALTSTGASTTSDDSGLFGFDGLPGGPHFMTVTKPGYRTTQQSSEVVPGVAEPAIVKVLLVADPSSLPFVVVHSYDGYIQCSFKAANFVFDAESCDPGGATGLSANDDSAPWFPVTGQPDFYQSEMQWQSTQTLGQSLVTIQWACNEGECGDDDFRLCNVRGPSPLVCRVNRTASLVEGGGGVGIEEAQFGTENMGYSVSMFANCFDGCVPGTVLGAGAVLEQRFQIYNHLFYGYQPPDGWLFLTDGPPPPPPT